MMHGNGLPVIGLLLVIVSCGACTASYEAPDPEALPYRFVEQREAAPFHPVDLQGDGQDERVLRWRRRGSNTAPDAVVLATLDRRTIQQVNYAATVVDRIQFLDLDNNGVLEVLVPIVRNDSLYVSIVAADGRKVDRLFVTTGRPRVEPEGTMPWDPALMAAFMADATNDGDPELILTVKTRYARLPRGVWVFAWPEKKQLGKQVVGTMINTPPHQHLGNFDEDEHPELFFTSTASDNGAEAGGLDDRHAYVGAFELSASPRLQWHRAVGGIWSSMRLTTGNLDGDGRPDVVTHQWTSRGRTTASPLQHIDPGSGRVHQERLFDQQIRDVAMVSVDRDTRDEILVLDTEGTLHVLDERLETRSRRAVGPQARTLAVVPDVDGDAYSEILLVRADGTLWLGPNLEVKAFMPQQRGRWRVVQRGRQQAPFLYAEAGGRAYLYTVSSNPLYLWHRYGTWVFVLAGLGGLVGLGWAGYASARRTWRLRTTRNRILDAMDEGLLLVDEDKRLEYANAPARAVLDLNGAPEEPVLLQQHTPALAHLIEQSETEQAPVEDVVEVEAGDHRIRAAADPLGGAGGNRWLIRLHDAPSVDEAGYRTWGLMAQRVAHDLKNPLTSMLLTLQRLQMEYRERAPDAADDLDAYTTRIEERIEHLRRMTKNFMKFIDAETPTLVRTDLNAFIAEQADLLRTGLPPDIELMLKCGDAVPAVHLDADQMQSVLENLMANAVNALPEGGRITIRTRLERGLQLRPNTSPRDYAEIEVQDTGVGMTAATREQLFEPGFTTAENGTGLGLSIVRKVVRDHDGYMEVESDPGVGSAICIYLPAGERPPTSSQP